MTLKCSHCGAPLVAEPDQALVTCGYCKTVTRIGSTRPPQPRTAPGSRPATQSWVVGLTLVLVAGGASMAYFAQSRARAVTPPVRAPEPALPSVAPLVAEPAPTPEAPDDPLAAPQAPLDAGTAPVHTTRRKTEPAPTGPISTKKEAEEILRPELLACMKESGVHYLITRLGNEPRGGTVPALRITETSVVDYKETPNFANTPLGRCVARAGSGVRAPAYGGNYIYFGLRNESIPDPLADARAHLDSEAAEKALSARDDEAHDCAHRSPSGGRPGESVSVMVYFAGATGAVSRVEPYYIDIRSAYGRCLISAYRKATVEKFREIESHVVHELAP